MFGILGTPLGWIMRFLYWFIPNYGLVLIVFTILIRLALFPLNVKQQKSSAKMALFQPKMQQLQKKYGKNKERYQEELMKLYQEEGFNPMASCLPMLLQMLFLFGIIDVVYKPLKHLLSIPKDAIEAATKVLTDLGVKSSYMELPIINAIQHGNVGDIAVDASAFGQIFSPDQIQAIQNFDLNFLGINLGNNPTWAFPLVLIPIISGITSLIVSFVSLRQQKKNGMGEQSGMGMLKGMMFIMPIFSTWIAFTLPSGVGLYWIASNVFSIFQTIILYRVYSPEKMKAKVEEEMKNRKKRPSRYQQAMKAAMEQQKALKGNGKETEPEEKGDEEINLTANQVIALARKRMAEKYGDEYDK
jgi:YidC/Oxa1 family membrane protein insertase